jgi:putative redox protein
MSQQPERINFDSQRAQPSGLSSGRVVVVETGTGRHQQLLCSGRHVMLADRSPQEGGEDSGPDPRQLMLMALGSHLSMTLRDKADKRGWPLEQILVRFEAPCSRRRKRTSLADQLFDVGTNCAIELVGDLDELQQAQLVDIANRQLIGWRSLAGLKEA